METLYMFAAFVCAFALYVILEFLFRLIFALSPNFYIYKLRLWGNLWSTDLTTFSKTRENVKFTPIPELVLLRKDNEELSATQDRLLFFLPRIAVSILLLLIAFISYRFDFHEFVFIIAFSAFILGMFWIFYGIYFYSTASKRLFAFTKSRLNQWIQLRIPIEKIDFPPMNSLSHLKATTSEKETYLSLRFFHCMVLRDYNGLDDTAFELDKILCNVSMPTINETPSFYTLVFYYSYMRPNMQKAMHYYEVIRETLLNDKDSNGMRVKAYYAYYVQKDAKSALDYVNAGLSEIDSFYVANSQTQERDFEKTLLQQLANAIEENSNVI